MPSVSSQSLCTSSSAFIKDNCYRSHALSFPHYSYLLTYSAQSTCKWTWKSRKTGNYALIESPINEDCQTELHTSLPRQLEHHSFGLARLSMNPITKASSERS